MEGVKKCYNCLFCTISGRGNTCKNTQKFFVVFMTINEYLLQFSSRIGRLFREILTFEKTSTTCIVKTCFGPVTPFCCTRSHLLELFDLNQGKTHPTLMTENVKLLNNKLEKKVVY